MGIINMFKSALLIASVSAIQLEGEPVQKKTKDIACHIGEGANGVGQSVCDMVKEATDVKPWPRTTPAPEVDHYYKGNEGEQWANADGTLKAAPEAPAAEPTDPKKEAAKAEKAATEEKPKEEKKEEAKEGEKKEEAKPAAEEKKEEAAALAQKNK